MNPEHAGAPPGRPGAARQPSTPDEELLGADHAAVVTMLTDVQRVSRMRSELVMGFERMASIHRGVSIFGSARTASSDPAYARCREIARRLGEAGFAIITGGGPGLMEAANRGARDAGSPSVGLAIDLPSEESANEHLDISLRFHYFFCRKVMFVRYASAFVVLPGGFGTLDELFESLTLIQTRKIRNFPVLLVDGGFWGGLVDWLRERMLAAGTIREEDLELLRVVEDTEEIVAIVAAAAARQGR